jgi:hypothetical protein
MNVPKTIVASARRKTPIVYTLAEIVLTTTGMQPKSRREISASTAVRTTPGV